MTDEKKIIWSYQDLFSRGSSEDRFYILSDSEIQLLLTIFRQIFWSSRWLDFPDESANINVFTNELAYRLMSPIDLCQAIADCIENNDSTKSALDTFLGGSGYGSGYQTGLPERINPADTADNLLPDDYVCSDDNLFGMASFIINQLHENTIQFIQEIEILTNPAEAISVTVDNIPVVGALGTSAEFVLWLQDQLIEYYEASWSLALYDDLRCELFCLMRLECSVTLDMLISLYESQFSLPPLPDINDISSIVDWLLDIAFVTPNQVIVGAFHWYILQFMSWTTPILDYISGLRTFSQVIALGKNETDSDWNVLCDCLPPPANYDETIQVGTNYSQYLSNIVGTLNATNLTSVYSPGTTGINNYGVSVEFNFTETLVETLHFQVSSYGTSGRQLYLWVYDSQGTQVYYNQSGWTDNQQIWLDFNDVNANATRIVVTCAFNGDTDMNSRLWKARATGIGIPPWLA